MEINHPLSYIELSQKNLEHNIAALKTLAKEGTQIALAIKGNAYGHGQNLIAGMAEAHVDYFLINSFEELKLLREISKKPTFVLGYILPSMLPSAVKLGCIMGVFSLPQLAQIEKAAAEVNMIQEVHIACDALLGREGFQEGELTEAFKLAKEYSHIKITGMYGHFANIEDTTDFTHAQKQIDTYERMQVIARDAGYTDLLTHLSATSGLLAYEMDSGKNPIIRLGIGAYGMWPNDTFARKYSKRDFILEPVLSWKTHVAQVKVLQPGMTIGYGLTYKTQKETRTALIPQGYADGFPRALSNTGMVLIGGRRCAVIGRVSMNMFVVDATNVPEVKEGDEVVIIGNQGDKSLAAAEVGERSGTINYEATTRISALLPRIII